jgi:hypothetical protein
MQDQTCVKRYNGDRALERGLQRMKAQGWTPQNVNTRKAAYSLMTGIFTRKQVHTVTFVKGGTDAMMEHFFQNKDQIFAGARQRMVGKPASDAQRKRLAQLFEEREAGDDPVLQRDRSGDPALDQADASDLIGQLSELPFKKGWE